MTKHYKIQSLYEASYLLAKGFKLISKESIGTKTSLVFEDSFELSKAVADFYNGDGEASAKNLFDNYRNLKDMIFQR